MKKSKNVGIIGMPTPTGIIYTLDMPSTLLAMSGLVLVTFLKVQSLKNLLYDSRKQEQISIKIL